MNTQFSFASYINILAALMLVINLTSCQQSDKTTAQSEAAQSEAAQKADATGTYAEISKAVGGNWDGKEYKNRTGFENVESFIVPDQLSDHSYYVRYEGPGWESNKVGYRLYLDWRNAIDIFGKKTEEMILDRVGQDGYDSYHEMSDWGMDILKVGPSLGIGSIGRKVGDTVMHFQQYEGITAKVLNQDNSSSVAVQYTGWTTGNRTIDLNSMLTIKADERKTNHVVTPSEKIDNLCTGIVKLPDTEVLTNTSENGKWAYLATYGKQTLVPDNLGMAILYQTETVASVEDGQHDHLIVFKETAFPISYYFLGAWEQEPGGIKNKDEFVSYLDGMLNTLKN